jgi:hypothetical protein
MILGMSAASFTVLHVSISLIGILSGFVILFGMFAARRLPGWTALFLLATVATSVTGSLFHSASFGPPHVVGAISVVVLAAAIFARYFHGLSRYGTGSMRSPPLSRSISMSSSGWCRPSRSFPSCNSWR